MEIEEKEPNKISHVQVGDVVIASSKESLEKCSKEVKDLLKDKTIKDYLQENWIKRPNVLVG